MTKGRRPNTDRIGLMVIHSHVLFRLSLVSRLSGEPGFDLAAECAETSDALEMLKNKHIDARHIDVVLLDFTVWRHFVPAAIQAGYQGKFIGIAEEIDVPSCARALSLGVAGIVLGSDSPDHLVQAIQVVATGGAWLDQGLLQLLAGRYPYHEDLCLDALSEREQFVLKGVLKGLTNRRIADEIGTS